MLKRIFFQMHWLIGISAGFVLALMGMTGALYCFEEELIQYFDPAISKVHPAGRISLTPAELLARIRAKNSHVSSLTLSNNPKEAGRVGFMNPIVGSDKKKFELQYLNPYTGELLGKPASEDFFRTVLNLHRHLSLDSLGKAITGASTLGLLFLILSGIYLRWPKIKRLSWRTWFGINFKVDGREKGRGFLLHLHAVSGTWLFLVYLLFALTGLTWSYDWYRSGLTSLAGTSKSQVIKVQTKSPILLNIQNSVSRSEADIELVWQVFIKHVPNYQKLILLLPSTSQQAVQILYLEPNAPHPYANNRIVIDGISGEVEKHELYTDKTNGEKLMASLYAIHSGNFFGFAGRLIMMLASLSLPFFVVTGWLMYLWRRKL